MRRVPRVGILGVGLLMMVALAGCSGSPSSSRTLNVPTVGEISAEADTQKPSPPAKPTTATKTTVQPPVEPPKTPAAPPTKKPPATPVCEKWTTAKQEMDAPVIQSQLTKAHVLADDKCFDRVEFVVDGQGAQADKPIGIVADWAAALTENPSDKPISMDGVILKVVVRAPTQGYAASGTSEKVLMKVGDPLPGKGRVIREAKFAGSFESQSTWGVGLDQKRPFRVSVHVENGKIHVWVDVAVL